MEPVEALRQLTARGDLSRDQTRGLFDQIMSGAVAPEILGAILAALSTKGETADEVAGATDAMRARVTRVKLPVDVEAIDTCGTGGDGKPTFNVSSAVAIVAAAAGATVAKHGNRSNSRPSGSAEGLSALGINVEADVATIERCLATCGVAFLYAIKLHPAMKHAGPVRKALGVRTIFNLVGPLTNPAGVRRQLLGVSRPEHVSLLSGVLLRLGVERAVVVHGRDGLCDVSVSGATLMAKCEDGVVTESELVPRHLGLGEHPLEACFVEGPEESAAVIEGVLAGQGGAPRDMVLANAAAALWVAGRVEALSDGVLRAAEAIDSGAARKTLAKWRQISGGQAGTA
jgi:anthranilate phosphoribosyltransferase